MRHRLALVSIIALAAGAVAIALFLRDQPTTEELRDALASALEGESDRSKENHEPEPTPRLDGPPADSAAPDVPSAILPLDEPAPVEREEVVAATVRSIRGRVVLPAGAPPEPELGVVLRWYSESGPQGRESTVAADGTFTCELPAGLDQPMLWLAADFLYLDPPIDLDLDELPDEFVLEPKVGGRLRVQFLLPPGLEAADVIGKSAWLSGWGVTRDAEIQPGLSAEFDGMPAKGSLELTVHVPGTPAARLDPVRVKRGRVADVQVPLSLPVVVSGRCVDEEARPLPDAEVTVSVETQSEGHSHQLRLDADGQFRIGDLPSGAASVEAKLVGYLEMTEELGHLDPGMERSGLVLVLHKGNVLSGRVLWPDGAPAVDARVEFEDPEREREDVIHFGVAPPKGIGVDESGRFELVGLGSTPVSVEASCRLREQDLDLEGLAPLRRKVTIQNAPWAYASAGAVPPDAQDLVLTLQRGLDLVGTVEDESGRPLDRFHVNVTERIEGEGFVQERAIASESFRRAAGKFRFESLRPGRYEVQAKADGEAESAPLIVELPCDPIRLVIPQGWRLSGRVLDAAGRPVSGAELQIVIKAVAGDSDGSEPDTQEFSGRSTAQGTFEIRGLPPGSGWIFAAHEELGLGGPAELRLGPDEPPADEIVLQLGGMGALEGTLHASVAERSGRQVEFMILAVEDAGRIECDTEGDFGSSPLPAGTYSLWIPEEPSTLVVVEVVADQTTHVVLGENREKPLVVRVRLHDAGAARSNEPIRAVGSDLAGEWASDARTDATGFAQFEVPRPGKVRFQIGFEEADGVEVERVVLDHDADHLDIDLSTARPIHR